MPASAPIALGAPLGFPPSHGDLPAVGSQHLSSVTESGSATLRSAVQPTTTTTAPEIMADPAETQALHAQSTNSEASSSPTLHAEKDLDSAPLPANAPDSPHAPATHPSASKDSAMPALSNSSDPEKAAGTSGMAALKHERSRSSDLDMVGTTESFGGDVEQGPRTERNHEDEEEREVESKKEGPDPFSVRFEPGEKANPKNWGYGYRWFLTMIAGGLVLNSTFASTSPSGILTDTERHFDASQEVTILTISLFVAGYCVGPIVWGPLSEAYGRRPIFILSFFCYTCFQVGCALAKNMASLLVFRFLGGCFAAAPMSNSGGVLADIWDGDVRGKAMGIFALAPFAGPSIGPIVAGFISVSGTDWRWVYWILAMFAGACLVVIILFMPETYTPILLAQKAHRLRKETGDDRWYAPIERTNKSFKAKLHDIVYKPFIMLALEPMLLATTVYMSFVYGLIYLLFEAYPFVFIKNHGFNEGENGLAFLGLLCGGFVGAILNLTFIDNRYQKAAAKVHPKPPTPEKRLEFCVVSGWLLVIGMFWFGWTSYPSIHWISPILASVFLGIGIFGMFVSLFNYAIDVYLWSAASALSAMTIVRSAFGAGFPLFATQMYARLGTQWASTLLGCLALLMVPIPMVLIKYGAFLRSKSRFAPNIPR